jgi:hypothetical protein
VAELSDEGVVNVLKRFEETLNLLVKMQARTQELIQEMNPNKTYSRTIIHKLRRKNAEQRHYIRELEKELKLTQS